MFTAIRTTIVTLVLLMAIMIPVSAASYQFLPSPADLGDLDHGYYYSWGINWVVPAGQHISEATLFISQINDWTTEANDHLYIHLLDNPQLGVKQWYDGEGGGDNWVANPLVANWTDTNSYAENLTYQFSTLDLLSPLRTYVANNNVFGLGFDPDCHYYNCGVKLVIETAEGEYPPVPEPSGIIALAAGMTSLGGLLWRRSA